MQQIRVSGASSYSSVRGQTGEDKSLGLWAQMWGRQLREGGTYVGVEEVATEVSPEPGGAGRALGLRAGDRPRPMAKCRGGRVTCRVGTEARLLAALKGNREELAVLSEKSCKGCRETDGGLGDLGAVRW